MGDNTDLEVIMGGVQAISSSFKTFLMLMALAYLRFKNQPPSSRRRSSRLAKKYNLSMKITRQLDHVRGLTLVSDDTCINHLRMSRDTFGRLCYLLENLGGLQPTRHVSIPEQVAIFLSILSHHKKHRVVKDDFSRSGFTISKHFNAVLKCVLSLHTILLIQPKPIEEDESTERWKYFKGCLGALDGTYVPVHVPMTDKPRYRNRKGFVSVNVLGVCDRNMNFVFVLSGWEGSAADGRVLRDAIARPNGLQVPNGNYYLCDGGYTNGNGFLAPYRGVRYHLQEWNNASQTPQSYKEFFNLMHARARNVIERSFGVLKARWGILRSNSFYPIKTQNHIILACCLLHNFIRTNAALDPIENEVPDIWSDPNFQPALDTEYIAHVQCSPGWTIWRDNMAMEMWNNRHS